MHWLGVASPTTIVLVYRASSNVNCYAQVGSEVSSSVLADTSVNDGLVRLEVTGLTANTSYTYTIFADGAQVATGTCNTLPATGGRWSIAVISCWQHLNEVGNWVKDVLDAHDPPVGLVYFGGDTPYTNAPTTATPVDGYGETIAGCEAEINAIATDGGALADFDYSLAANADAVRDVMYAHHRSFRRTPGVKKVIERYNTLWAASDHEYPGNGTNRGDYTALNEGIADVVANATQMTDLMLICREAYNAYHIGNPPNVSAYAQGAFGDYEQVYWNHRVNDDVEIFGIEDVWLRDSSAADKADRVLYGDDQLDWLTAAMGSSTATFKPILTPTPAVGGNQTFAKESGPHPQTADASDDGERDLLFRMLDDQSGVVMMSGDIHHTFLSVHNGVAVFNACPLSSSQNNGTADNNKYDSGAVWWNDGLGNGVAWDSNTGTWNGVIGFLDFEPSVNRMYVRFYHQRRDSTFTIGYVAAGSNALTYPRTRIA